MHDFLPNLFVLGVARCGTTTLHNYLSDMPEICMSDPKEPFFFECEYERGIEYYRKTYFSHWRNENIIGESRHRNLYLPYVPERIYKTNPEAKLVVILRNPIERAFSHWQHWHSRGLEKLGFSKAIMADYERIKNGLHMETQEERVRYCNSLYTDHEMTGRGIYRTYLDSGYYLDQINRYVNLFPLSNLLVLLFDDLVQKSNEVISNLRSFLGLEPHSYRISYVLHEDQGVTRLHRKILDLTANLRRSQLIPTGIKQYIEGILKRIEPKNKIDPETRKWLYNHYYKHNSALGAFLNRDLSHWR